MGYYKDKHVVVDPVKVVKIQLITTSGSCRIGTTSLLLTL